MTTRPEEAGSRGLRAPGGTLSRACSRSFTLSLLDNAAHVPVTLRASFTDRTLAWVSPWGRKKLISAPFLFYPQRFFEVGPSQARPSGRLGAGQPAPTGENAPTRALSPPGRCQAPRAQEPRSNPSGRGGGVGVGAWGGPPAPLLFLKAPLTDSSMQPGLGASPMSQTVKLRPRAGDIHVEGLVARWAPVPLCFTVGPACPLRGEGLAGRGGGRAASARQAACRPRALLSQVLLLCQEGGLKLALNGQGLGATSLGRQVLERLRELRVSGSVQLYCVHH